MFLLLDPLSGERLNVVGVALLGECTVNTDPKSTICLRSDHVTLHEATPLCSSVEDQRNQKKMAFHPLPTYHVYIINQSIVEYCTLPSPPLG